MTDFPKCVKAEMLPGPKLVCEFDNGEVRYYPVDEQIELLMRPADVLSLKKTHGANLFLGGAMTWIGNDILIEDNGDLLLNKAIIPGEILYKYSLAHLNEQDSRFKANLTEIEHPILEGFKRINLIWIALALLTLVAALVMLIFDHS